MTLRGTCPACFRDMPVLPQRKLGVSMPDQHFSIARHGWQEQGGREVGVYNKAWHEGACFGVGWLPFEISTEGTHEYLKRRLFPVAMMRENALQHYATRPEFIERDDDIVRETHGFLTTKVACPYVTRIKPGDVAVERRYVHLRATGSYFIPAVPSYDSLLASHVEQVEAELRIICIEARHCYSAISAWTSKELRDEERAATIHYRASGARVAYCGSHSHGIYTTENEREATCTRCKKALDAQAARVAAQNAVAADSETLIEWLRKIGKPVTVAEIKKGLGWDAKRFNAAYDKADRFDRTSPRHIDRTWTKPTRYSIKETT